MENQQNKIKKLEQELKTLRYHHELVQEICRTQDDIIKDLENRLGKDHKPYKKKGNQVFLNHVLG